MPGDTALATPPAGAAAVRIEIDPDIPGHILQGRCDWLIRGRIVSARPALEAVLLLAGNPVARMGFGRSGTHRLPAPDEDGSHVAVFHLHLSRPLALAGAPCQFEIAATVEGGAAAAECTLAPEPDRPGAARLTRGATHRMTGPEVPRPPIVLYVEQAARDAAGRLAVHGWAVAYSPVIAVQALVGERAVASATLTQQRDDVAAVLPMYPNAAQSGFALHLPGILPDGAESVAIRAVTRDGALHELVRPLARVAAVAPPPAPAVRAAAPAQPEQHPERRKIHYHWDIARIDEAGGVLVEGWAVCRSGILDVGLELEDRPLGTAELGNPRPDVGVEFPDIPLARVSGFRLHRSLAEAAAAPGTQRLLRLTVRNGLDDITQESRVVSVSEAVAPAAAADPGGAFRVEIDSPAVVAGAVPGTVAGRLVIEGWALARAGLAGIDVLLDGAKLGEAHVGLARQDVGAAHPEWEGALRSGFAFHCPPRALPEGAHVVELAIRARDGGTLRRSFSIAVRKSGENQQCALRRRVSRAESDLIETVLARRDVRPRFQLLLPVPADADPAALAATLGSLAVQAWRDWRLLLLPADAKARTACRNATAGDDARNIRVEAPARARLDPKAALVAVLAPGDELGADALLEIALTCALHPDADFLYADDIRANPSDGAAEPFFKPAWSPDLLLSCNYIGRAWFAAPALLARAGLDAGALAALRTYDAVLRLTECAAAVTRVPKLLLALAPPPAPEDGRTALEQAAQRRGIAAEILDGAAPGFWRFRRTPPETPADGAGLVSIIIPTCAAHGHIKTCLDTLRAVTAHRHFEIVCVENIPASEPEWKAWLAENADAVISTDEPFNWSRYNNLAVRAARGDFLLFLNDDIEIVEPGWLDAMLEHARRPEVGAVGARLLYPDRKVQHAGMFLAEPGIGRHAFRFAPADEPGYFGLALMQRNAIAVTGACMLVRRADFEALGGFDETHDITNNDLDYCLRVHQAGRLCVFTPHATLIHHELASRGHLPDRYDRNRFQSRWDRLFAAGDPYFSPRLSRHADDVRPDEEPVEPVVAGPLFRAADIRRILVVKLDHIGDFITALPAIRRLKQRFPAASITLLASPAACGLAGAAHCIDEAILFQFFNPRSELGRMSHTDAELAALRARLAQGRFDLAVDLRKLGDTRFILQLSGAPLLAGFDHLGEFAFLDIALEWESDRALQRKRAHVGADLLALVESVASAGDDIRNASALAAATPAAVLDALPEDVRPLFDRPVVIVHPSAGASNKEWPAANFAALINELVARFSLNAILIGAPDDRATERAVLDAVRERAHVGSLVGRLPLRDLPALFAASTLYIGTDSGPKHIAAATGVPTLGIHSGTVDAIEWAPLGPAAIALRRGMSCSPCYIARAEDCPRNLACLRELEPDSVLPYTEMLLGLAPTSRPRPPARAPRTKPGRTPS